MVVWLNELDCSVLLVHEIFDGCCCLIISDVKCRLESFVGEDFEDGFECGHDVTLCCGCDGDGKDVVRIVSISHKKIAGHPMLVPGDFRCSPCRTFLCSCRLVPQNRTCPLYGTLEYVVWCVVCFGNRWGIA